MSRPRFDVPVPKYMRGLPRDSRGYLVPCFVQWMRDRKPVPPLGLLDGAEPDFRVIDTAFFGRAVKQRLCWICGNPLGRYQHYVIGPMCAINRITSEPPSHRDCAEYALQVCPMMLNPNMRRDLDYSDLDDDTVAPAGMHDDGNPGSFVQWVQTAPVAPELTTLGKAGVLLRLADPTEVHWWTRGRRATFAEADLALTLGLDKLERIARERDGAGGIVELRRLYEGARTTLPKEQ